MTPPGADLAGPLDAAPMRWRQLVVLALALLLGMLDGYDALAMAFAAPAVSRAWHLDKAVLGLLLSSGLIGMAVGALALAPVADRIGRRPAVLGGVAAMTVGALLSGLSGSTPALFACRVVTGVGIGVAVAMTTLLSAEFANARSRPLAVSVVATAGFPLGGVAGGLTASALLPTLGWPWVFGVGAIGGAAFLLVLPFALPESPSYLAALRSPDALERLNRALTRLGHAPVAALPPIREWQTAGYGALFASGAAGLTLRLAAVIVLISTSAYYLLNWLPPFVAEMGFAPATGGLVSAFSNLIGVPGGVIVGVLARRIAPARLAAAVMVGMGLFTAAVGFTPARLPPIFVAAGGFGFFLSAAVGAFYGIMAASFPPLTRASGIGLVMGAGRVASAVGPALAGWLFAHGLSRADVSLGFAAGPVIAAALILGLPRASMRGEAGRAEDRLASPAP